MKSLIARRRLLLSLPALTLTFGIRKAAAAETPAEQLGINAADALLHYRTLLESVRGDAYESAAKTTVKALETCDDKLAQLRETVADLQKHLQSQSKWPELQRRFATIEQSLELVQDKRTGQLNEDALRALPAALEGLHALMKEISSACNADPNGEIQNLVDRIYSRIADQNTALADVDTQREKWSQWLDQIRDYHQACGNAMDDAAQAVCDGERGQSNWRQQAVASLTKAISALNGIKQIDAAMAAAAPQDNYKRIDTKDPQAPHPAIDVLSSILEITRKSLVPPETALFHPASYSSGDGQPASNAVPSLSLNQTNAGLVAEVQQLVRQPRYFTPGSTTQTINCIAVCWPVWIVYPSNGPDDVANRTSLIASALYFGLIRGAKRDVFSELSAKLQGIYIGQAESLGA